MKKDNNSRSTGLQGEEIASRYLTKKGYKIITRNYHGEHFEIDIVAEYGNMIVFCEVKTSRTDRFGPSISWVTPGKIKHITRAASDYIATHDTKDRSFRFDVIGLDVREGKIKINHIENAFSVPEKE